MILRRLGNKKKLAKTLLTYFPKHDLYIEPFFGAGGMFFNKPKAKYNIMNDLDSDVFNLFQVVSNQKDELEEAWLKMPIHIDLWEHWKKNKEEDPIQRALRFLFLSNYGYMGKPETLRYNSGNTTKIVYENIDKTSKYLFGVEFMNCSFEDMFKKISFKSDNEKNRTFIYCDPPYLDSDDNYEASFTDELSNKLFDVLEECGAKWAMSEFDHPFILEQAKKRGLITNYIGERQNLKNRRTEVLITNYENAQQSLF